INILKKNKAREIRVAESEEEADKLLQIRATMYLAINALSKARIIEDVCVPIDRIIDYLAKVKELSQKYGLTIAMNGHAGDGNIHPSILYDPDNPEEVVKANEVVDELIRYSTDIGGTITGEHGVGLQKMRHLSYQLSLHNGPQVLGLMKGLKKLFDPNNILNPGKYLD
ncbi:MAG: FAD-linked oxidase C-terminal domain-containing protein, partial [Candidatus Caldarchaeum sp.]